MQTDFEMILESCGKDVYTHCKNVGALIREIIVACGKPELLDLWCTETYAPCDYHDIGKFEEEKSALEHCDRGTFLFETAYNDAHSTQEKVFCSIASDLCRYHHERWDGTGGLYHYKGDDISIIARAGAVANAWDHLIQDESNGETRHLFQKIEDGAGTLFDPEMVKALKICLF